MKIVFLTIVAVFFNIKAYACEQGEIAFSQNNICAEVQWQTTPVFNQYTSATITLKNNQTYTLNVIPWMVMAQGHEHGSRPVTITNVSPNDYLIEKIYFMGGMKGEWFLRLQLLNDKKQVVEEGRMRVNL